jgi:X-Pro dipeptidyl-peptidase
LGDSAGDDTFDYTPFWAERDYVSRIGPHMPAVLQVQGMTDPKVYGRQFARYWQRLAAWNIPRRLWLHGGDHQDPDDVAQAQWRAMLHRWMDHWLYGVDNGVMTEPRVDLQRPGQGWERHADWPIPGTSDVRLSFEQGPAGGPGTLTAAPATAPAVDRFTDNPDQSGHAAVADPMTHNPHRLVYWTPPLTAPAHISGTPRISALVSADRPSTPLTALLVDYDSPQIVSRGSIDTKNRYSLQFARPLEPGQRYLITWTMHATDYVFAAGHRIGLVLVANDVDYVTPDPSGATIQLTTTVSGVTLPVVGGQVSR